MNEEELNILQELIERKIQLAEVTGGLTSSDKKFIDLWNYMVELQQRIDKTIKGIETFKDDIKKYQEQDKINHQNISIGLVGIRLNTFLKDLKGKDN